MNVMNIHHRDFGHPMFTTDLLEVAERWPAFLDLGKRLANVECEPLDDTFFADAKFGTLPALKLACFHSSALRSTRSPGMADESDNLNLHICKEGVTRIAHLGREATVRAGECILLTSADTLLLDRSEARFTFVSIPRPVLAPMIADLDAVLMTPMSGSSDAFQLLQAHLATLKDIPGASGPELRALMAAHVHDLVAVAIGATRDASELAAGRGLRAARLKAIKADIESNLVSGDVGSDALASRHRVSPRYIRKLFEGEGTSLSQFVLGRRLALVHRALLDPRLVHRTIGAIAFDAGFGDLSTFNHAFRRHFGMTPSEARQSAAGVAA